MAKHHDKDKGKKGGKHERGAKRYGKHRSDRPADEHTDSSKCRHPRATKTRSAAGKGGYDHSCPACGTTWWSEN